MVVDLFKTEPQRDPLIGRTLDGRYEVLGRLGEGGVGVVYRGRQTQLNRFVAIKVLHPDAAASPEWRQRFAREARALSALAHPNVVPVTDSGIDRGVPYLVMELLEGRTLDDLIKEGPLPLWRALDIARQTLRGVAFAHGKGIIHRDLKPANVFLQALPDQDDHVRLLDFGMAKFLDGTSARSMADTVTRVGAVFGSVAYMSPEQVKAAPSDARTDVYAAGVLLFELLAGRRPFVADSHEGYMGAHLTQPVPSLAKTRSGIPAAAAFQVVIERAMAKKPAARFSDAAAMLAALEMVVAKLPASALRRTTPKAAPKAVVKAPRNPTPPTRALSPARSRSRFWRHVLVLVTFTAAIGAVAVYVRRDDATPVKTATRPAAPAPKVSPPAPPSSPPAPKPALAPELPPTAELPPPPTTPPPTKPEPPSAPQATAEAPAEEAAPPEQPKQTKPPKQPVAEAQPQSDARNPWQQPVPRELKSIRDRVNRGAKVSQKALKPVYAYARQNPGDPRPWLLLGRAYAQVDWYTDSVERYVRAHREDSTCRGDPQMLADLLAGAAHPTAGRNAARAIRDIYGVEALPALEKALEHRAGHREATARLARLRDALLQ